MKYTVEYRFGRHSNEYDRDEWTIDADFDNLSDAVAHAAKECIGNPRMRHRIVKSCEPEELMVFPAIEEL
jgi:hypothetical protein